MRRLVLVGGGHAHLEVLRALAMRPLPGVEVVLISPERVQPYSSMLPGFLRHRFEAREMTFDLAGLTRRAGAAFLQNAAEHIDGVGRVVDTGVDRMEFDVASLDVGSAPAGTESPGVSENALQVRPWSAVLQLRERLDAAARSDDPFGVSVVGAGAGGFEVAMAIARRLNPNRGSGRVVRLLERGRVILEEFPERARSLALEVLSAAGVQVRTAAVVARVARDHIVLGSNEHCESNITVWLGGAAPPRLTRTSNLPRDETGYFSVNGELRSADGSPVFGAGDCVTLRHHPTLPKAGVYAVRQAPVLAHNLRAVLEGKRPRQYEPQRRFLALLDTAEGAALLRYGSFAAHGRPASWLKRMIDHRFMQRYRKFGA